MDRCGLGVRSGAHLDRSSIGSVMAVWSGCVTGSAMVGMGLVRWSNGNAEWTSSWALPNEIAFALPNELAFALPNELLHGGCWMGFWVCVC
jgi:hypothetical protein